MKDKLTGIEKECKDCGVVFRKSWHWYMTMRISPFVRCDSCRNVRVQGRKREVAVERAKEMGNGLEEEMKESCGEEKKIEDEKPELS